MIGTTTARSMATATAAARGQLRGKEAVRQYMATAYVEPPKFMVGNLIAEGEFVTAIGRISLKNENGVMVDYDYCDVWRFRDGKMAGLKAFVIETKAR